MDSRIGNSILGKVRNVVSSWMSLTTPATRTYGWMPPINPLATRTSHSVARILVVLDSFAVLPLNSTRTASPSVSAHAASERKANEIEPHST